jgi:hypothetical protein
MRAVARGGKRMRAHRITVLALLACTALVPSAASRADAVKSWSAVPADRYEVLGTFNDAAFLDKDTGLVWARTVTTDQEMSSASAATYCKQLFVGNKGGWRLPQFEEISSLLEFNGTSIVTNAPFIDYQPDQFYVYPSGFINTVNGSVVVVPFTERDIMCVRGGTNN